MFDQSYLICQILMICWGDPPGSGHTPSRTILPCDHKLRSLVESLLHTSLVGLTTHDTRITFILSVILPGRRTHL